MQGRSTATRESHPNSAGKPHQCLLSGICVPRKPPPRPPHPSLQTVFDPLPSFYLTPQWLQCRAPAVQSRFVNGRVRPGAMGWTPPHLTASMCQTGSVIHQSQGEGVHHEAYSRWGRFGKERLPGARRGPEREAGVAPEAERATDGCRWCWRQSSQAARLAWRRAVVRTTGRASCRSADYTVKLIAPQFVKPYVQEQQERRQ